MEKIEHPHPGKPKNEDKEIQSTPNLKELPAPLLWSRCDPESLGFQTTNDLPDLQSVIGQPRAFRSLSHWGRSGYLRQRDRVA